MTPPPPLSARQRRQETIVSALRAALEDAERGNLESVLVLAELPDYGQYRLYSSSVADPVRTLGLLEIAKHNILK